MAFYRKKQLNGKWYPRAVTLGRTADTDEVAERLSEISTVTRGDTYAVLANLGGVLASIMAEGRSVRLEGIGTFFYNCRCVGQGVDTPEEVSQAQIKDVRVSFIPEYKRAQNNQVMRRTLVEREVEWIDAGETGKTSQRKERQAEKETPEQEQAQP